jgi:hypothetical protein
VRYLTLLEKPFSFTFCERRVTDGKRIPVMAQRFEKQQLTEPHGHHASRKSLGPDGGFTRAGSPARIRVPARPRRDLIMAILLFM